MSSIKRDQFKATQLWNKAIDIFVKGVPLAKHRRLLNQFSQSFVASESVSWFHSVLQSDDEFGQSVTRDQVVLLVRKLYESGVIKLVKRQKGISLRRLQSFGKGDRSNSHQFEDDSALYRLSDDQLSRRIDMVTSVGSPQPASKRLESEPSEAIVLKVVALRSLKETLQVTDMHDSLDTRCLRENHLMSNIQGSMATDDVFPGWVRDAMTYLTDWPHNSNNCAMATYPGFEVDVLSVVENYFTSLATPLLPRRFGVLLCDVLVMHLTTAAATAIIGQLTTRDHRRQQQQPPNRALPDEYVRLAASQSPRPDGGVSGTPVSKQNCREAVSIHSDITPRPTNENKNEFLQSGNAIKSASALKNVFTRHDYDRIKTTSSVQLAPPKLTPLAPDQISMKSPASNVKSETHQAINSKEPKCVVLPARQKFRTSALTVSEMLGSLKPVSLDKNNTAFARSVTTPSVSKSEINGVRSSFKHSALTRVKSNDSCETYPFAQTEISPSVELLKRNSVEEINKGLETNKGLGTANNRTTVGEIKEINRDLKQTDEPLSFCQSQRPQFFASLNPKPTQSHNLDSWRRAIKLGENANVRGPVVASPLCLADKENLGSSKGLVRAGAVRLKHSQKVKTEKSRAVLGEVQNVPFKYEVPSQVSVYRVQLDVALSKSPVIDHCSPRSGKVTDGVPRLLPERSLPRFNNPMSPTVSQPCLMTIPEAGGSTIFPRHDPRTKQRRSNSPRLIVDRQISENTNSPLVKTDTPSNRFGNSNGFSDFGLTIDRKSVQSEAEICEIEETRIEEQHARKTRQEMYQSDSQLDNNFMSHHGKQNSFSSLRRTYQYHAPLNFPREYRESVIGIKPETLYSTDTECNFYDDQKTPPEVRCFQSNTIEHNRSQSISNVPASNSSIPFIDATPDWTAARSRLPSAKRESTLDIWRDNVRQNYENVYLGGTQILLSEMTRDQNLGSPCFSKQNAQSLLDISDNRNFPKQSFERATSSTVLSPSYYTPPTFNYSPQKVSKIPPKIGTLTDDDSNNSAPINDHALSPTESIASNRRPIGSIKKTPVFSFFNRLSSRSIRAKKTLSLQPGEVQKLTPQNKALRKSLDYSPVVEILDFLEAPRPLLIQSPSKVLSEDVDLNTARVDVGDSDDDEVSSKFEGLKKTPTISSKRRPKYYTRKKLLKGVESQSENCLSIDDDSSPTGLNKRMVWQRKSLNDGHLVYFCPKFDQIEFSFDEQNGWPENDFKRPMPEKLDISGTLVPFDELSAEIENALRLNETQIASDEYGIRNGMKSKVSVGTVGLWLGQEETVPKSDADTSFVEKAYEMKTNRENPIVRDYHELFRSNGYDSIDLIENAQANRRRTKPAQKGSPQSIAFSDAQDRNDLTPKLVQNSPVSQSSNMSSHSPNVELASYPSLKPTAQRWNKDPVNNVSYMRAVGDISAMTDSSPDLKTDFESLKKLFMKASSLESFHNAERTLQSLKLVLLFLPHENRVRLYHLLLLIEKLASNESFMKSDACDLSERRCVLLARFFGAIVFRPGSSSSDAHLPSIDRLVDLVLALSVQAFDCSLLIHGLQTTARCLILARAQSSSTSIRLPSQRESTVSIHGQDSAGKLQATGQQPLYCDQVPTGGSAERTRAALRQLLSAIRTDPRLDETRRAAQLRQFMALHPDVYLSDLNSQ